MMRRELLGSDDCLTHLMVSRDRAQHMDCSCGQRGGRNQLLARNDERYFGNLTALDATIPSPVVAFSRMAISAYEMMSPGRNP